MTDATFLDFSQAPNDKYRKFFGRFSEIDQLETKDWKPIHLLAYFARKYHATYGITYAWKFNNPAPSKCFEMWQIGVLVSKLSADPQILREYIDWAFQTLVPKAKRRLTSISFMTREEVLIPYKTQFLFGNQKPRISRATPLPPNYQQYLQQMGHLHISTYGDLSFLTQADPTLLDKLRQANLDVEILERVV